MSRSFFLFLLSSCLSLKISIPNIYLACTSYSMEPKKKRKAKKKESAWANNMSIKWQPCLKAKRYPIVYEPWYVYQCLGFTQRKFFFLIETKSFIDFINKKKNRRNYTCLPILEGIIKEFRGFEALEIYNQINSI